MFIHIQFKKQSDERVREAIKKKGAHLISALERALNETMRDLMARVQQKLSGEVLQNRRGGGGLLGTVRMLPAERFGSTLSGYVTAGGGPASAYAEVQEYGGTRQYDIYPVNKQALAFFPEGSLGSNPEKNLFSRSGIAESGRLRGLRLYHKQGEKRGTLKPENYQKFADLGGIVVKHVVHPPLPERSYMRSALEELRGEIIARIYDAAAKAIQ